MVDGRRGRLILKPRIEEYDCAFVSLFSSSLFVYIYIFMYLVQRPKTDQLPEKIIYLCFNTRTLRLFVFKGFLR